VLVCTPGPLSILVHPRGIPLTPKWEAPIELLKFTLVCTPGPLSILVHPRGMLLTPKWEAPTELLKFTQCCALQVPYPYLYIQEGCRSHQNERHPQNYSNLHNVVHSRSPIHTCTSKRDAAHTKMRGTHRITQIYTMLCTPGPLSVRVHPRGIPLTPWRRTPTELLDFSAFIPGSDWWRKSGWAADCALSKQNKIYTVMLWCLMTRKSLRFDLNQFGCIQVSFKRVLWQAKQKGPSKQLLLNCNTDKVISNNVKWMYELKALATRASKYNDASINSNLVWRHSLTTKFPFNNPPRFWHPIAFAGLYRCITGIKHLWHVPQTMVGTHAFFNQTQNIVSRSLNGALI